MPETERKPLESYFDFDRKALFEKLLDLLAVFRKLCEENDLTWFALGGTMLGAVRHQGFIPWDDDIDLGMLRKDYDKLLQLIGEKQDLLPEPYRFLTPLTDAQYGKGLIRLCNCNTTAISRNNAIFDYNHGIFVDVFPLDAVPDDPSALKKHRRKMKLASEMLALSSRYPLGKTGAKDLTKSHKIIFWCLYPFYKTGVLSHKWAFRLLTKTASAYEAKGQKNVCLSTLSVAGKYTAPLSCYSEFREMPFENTTIPVSTAHAFLLENQYGSDYMTPIRQSTLHGDTLYVPDVPYKEFVAEYRKELIEMSQNRRKK